MTSGWGNEPSRFGAPPTAMCKATFSAPSVTEQGKALGLCHKLPLDRPIGVCLSFTRL